MNLLLLSTDEIANGNPVAIAGRRLAHLREVLRVEVGDAIAVGELDGKLGRGIVRELDEQRAILQVELDVEPPPPLGIELLLALPRPKILRRVLQAAASMGCKRIALVGSYRVEKSYFASPLLAPEAIREQLLLGLEQGRDTRVPQVSVHRFFKPFIEDELETLFPGTTRLLAHPKAEGTLNAPRRPVLLAIGPEGGWTEYEARVLHERGFAPFSAGPRPLRVDVAVPYLVGQVAALGG